MKKITLIVAAFGLISLASCKKDRVCACTNTTTSSSGNVNTQEAANITYKNMRMSDAKSLCQKSTVVDVNSGGGTTTRVYDCKLK